MFRLISAPRFASAIGQYLTAAVSPVLAIAISLAAAGTALAATVIETPRTITSLTVRGNVAILYYSPAAALAPEGCNGLNATLAVVIDVSPATGDKAVFAAALAAFHAGSTVGFVVDGCGPDDLPRAVQINVQP